MELESKGAEATESQHSDAEKLTSFLNKAVSNIVISMEVHLMPVI
jgi:hypothetical protein